MELSIFFSLKRLQNFRFIELIIAQGICHINVPLQKSPELYSNNTYFKRDKEQGNSI